MKTLITIIIVIAVNANIEAQTKKYDYLIFDSLCINGFYLGGSVAEMKELLGKPSKEYSIEPQPDCEEWCEKSQRIYVYGVTEYIKVNQGQKAISECKLKELIYPKTSGIITAFELNNPKNIYVLNYKGCDFFIGDSINDPKFKAIMPNAYDFYTKIKNEGKNISYLKAYLSEPNGKIAYSKGVEFIMFHFDNSNYLIKIEINYPKE